MEARYCVPEKRSANQSMGHRDHGDFERVIAPYIEYEASAYLDTCGDRVVACPRLWRFAAQSAVRLEERSGGGIP